MKKKQTVCFYETFGLWDWVLVLFTRSLVFLAAESFWMRQLLKVRGRKVGIFRKLSDGDLDRSPDIRRHAYESALIKADQIAGRIAFLSKEEFLGINLDLLVRKYLVEELFRKYQFYGLADRYAQEHPELECTLHMDPILLGDAVPSYFSISAKIKVGWPRSRYFVTLLFLPLYLVLFYRKYAVTSKPAFENAFLCRVDGKKSYEMFRSLLGDKYPLQFFIDRAHLVSEVHFEYLSMADKDRLGLHVNGLDALDFGRLKEFTRKYIRVGFRHFFGLAAYGAIYASLFGIVLRGSLLVPRARGCLYLTYEHLVAENAVRNELLRRDGNLSVSVPYGTQVESHYFSSGYKYNYDILCASGELQERLYSLQAACTKIILPVGSYEVNRGGAGDDSQKDRLRDLLNFKGADVAITILSSGFQSETYSGEMKLMQFANRLAAQDGVKIIIRPKPLPPPEGFRGVLESVCGGDASILITGAEYELRDFLPVSDLFITFASHSAADICAAGGQIFCVNFLDDSPFSLWQSAVEGVYLDADSAFEVVMSWVADGVDGRRDIHRQRMRKLAGMISYKFDKFYDYRENFQRQLTPFVCSGQR